MIVDWIYLTRGRSKAVTGFFGQVAKFLFRSNADNSTTFTPTTVQYFCNALNRRGLGFTRDTLSDK